MVEDIFNVDNLTEDIDVEAKRAGGRNGKGTLPNDVWETYSAFANSEGGVILLGVTENEGVFRATGIREPERVLGDFWNQINNPQKVSRNLLSNASVRRLPAGNGRWVLGLGNTGSPGGATRAADLYQRQSVDRHIQTLARRRLSLPRGRSEANARRANAGCPRRADFGELWF